MIAMLTFTGLGLGTYAFDMWTMETCYFGDL